MRWATVASVVVAAALAAVTAGASASGAPTTASSAHPGCASFYFTSGFAQGIESAIGGGARVVRYRDAPWDFVSETSKFAPGTSCIYGWVIPANGTPKGDPWPLGNIAPSSMQVGWGATAKDWSALVAREASDPVEGSGTRQSLLRLGGGEKGFLETRPSGDPAPTKTDGDLYSVYILRARRSTTRRDRFGGVELMGCDRRAGDRGAVQGVGARVR